MALESLDIRRRSAGRRRRPTCASAEVAKLIDISRCIGCKACQVACMEWNDVRDDVGFIDGTYNNPIDLTDRTWTVMRFYEEEIPDVGLQWLIVKDGCLHCADPGCLKACPAPGAIVQYSNGIVDFKQDNCIGCGYCQTGCPFNIPRYGVNDRQGLQVHALLRPRRGRARAGVHQDLPDPGAQLRDQGGHDRHRERAGRGAEGARLDKAAVYDPSGVGGTHVVYVMPHGDPELYRMPRDASISPLVGLWRSGFADLGVLTMVSVVVAGFFHWMKVGPVDPDARPPREEE